MIHGAPAAALIVGAFLVINILIATIFGIRHEGWAAWKDSWKEF